jgi:hypothetical protein
VADALSAVARLGVALAATVALAGCAIYVAYAKPGVLSPEQQVEQLEHDRDAARAANAKLPPGWHAHLAWLYEQTGRADLAREELLAEKTAFPESSAFVQTLLRNLDGRSAPARGTAP